MGRERAWAALRTEYLLSVTKATARSRRRSLSAGCGGWSDMRVRTFMLFCEVSVVRCGSCGAVGWIDGWEDGW